MSVPDWLFTTLASTSATTTLILILAWLCRQMIATRLKASVQHDFDQKLEAIRTDFRKSEELLKSDLRAKENQIATMQSGALSGLVSRQVALDKRRLEAIEQLWVGIETLLPLKLATVWMQTINFEKAQKTAAENPLARDMFSQFAPKLDPKTFPKVDVHRARPFVSEMAWALFSAYQAIVGYATTQLHILRVGLNVDILDPAAVSKLILAALPHYGDYIEKSGAKCFPYIVEPLELELLKELRRMMRGDDSDNSNVEQAAKIMQAVMAVNESICKGSAT